MTAKSPLEASPLEEILDSLFDVDIHLTCDGEADRGKCLVKL